MKLLYATLTGTALAAQPLLDFIQAKIDEGLEVTDDGFNLNYPPYFEAQVSENGLKGKVAYSLDGVNKNVENWSIYGSGEPMLHLWGDLSGAVSREFGVPAAEGVDTWSYDVGCDFSADTVELTTRHEVSFLDGTEGDCDTLLTAEFDVEKAGDNLNLGISLTDQRTQRNLDRLEDTLLWNIMSTYDMEYNGDLSVKKVSKCEDFAAGCAVSVESSLEGSWLPAVKNFQASFNIRPYAAVFKTEGVLVFLRKVDLGGKGLKLSNRLGFWSLHASSGTNWQDDLKNDMAELVIRVPTGAQWSKESLPELNALLAPFERFFETISMNPEKIPYLFYYLDKFFATFENEFDCSVLVKTTNIESELLAGGTLNDQLVDTCYEANKIIIGAIQDPQLKTFMGYMRQYVKRMDSKAGQQEFQRIFGGIF